MQILGLLGMYFDAVLVEVEKNLLLFRLALAILHTGRNCFNLFQISFSANTGVSGVSGVAKDQKNCEKFKTTHCQFDHSPIME